MKRKLVRRDFFRFGAGGAIGAATAGITMRDVSRINALLASEEIEIPRGEEGWANSICTLCAGGCGLRVRKIGDRAVRIQGNPLHPVNRGGLCPKGVAGLQALYHPDRLKVPMKNTGTRREPRWKEIEWEEALDTLAARLSALQRDKRPHSLVWIDQSRRNLLVRLAQQFLAVYGSPNFLTMPSGLDAFRVAVHLQQGLDEPLAFDFERTRYLLSFGVNLLEGWGSPAAIMRAFGHWRDPARQSRAKVVQIDSRFSPTATRADEWVPIRPGAEAAFALGIAYVLITEGLYDAPFVEEHTFGFEDWRDGAGKLHTGFRTLVIEGYRLNDVAARTGVPAEKVLRIAREFGENRPALAIGDTQSSTLTGNPYAAMAVHSLNALLGSVGRPGGAVLQEQPALPPLAPGSGAAAESRRVDSNPEGCYPGRHLCHLPRAILSGNPYPVEALFLNDVNPVFSLPAGEAFREAFEKVPFIASFSSFPNETSAMADLILPLSTDLERWQDAGPPPTFPFALQSVSPPVLQPQHSTRDVADVLLELAGKLGGPVAESLPFTSFEEYLRAQADGLFSAGTGSTFTTSLEEMWYRLLERSGWWAPSYSNAAELWEQMSTQGGWWEPGYFSYDAWGQLFRTPSGRFEFYSNRLAEWAREHPDTAVTAGAQAGGDQSFLPHQPDLGEPPEEYPLLLLAAETLPLSGGEGSELPYLQQISGPHLFEQWGSWLEIHPETARELGVSDRDMVWVESPKGRGEARARLYEGARPGVVHLPLGYGRQEGSAWCRRGLNPLALMEENPEPLTGMPQTNGTYVKVYRS